MALDFFEKIAPLPDELAKVLIKKELVTSLQWQKVSTIHSSHFESLKEILEGLGLVSYAKFNKIVIEYRLLHILNGLKRFKLGSKAQSKGNYQVLALEKTRRRLSIVKSSC